MSFDIGQTIQCDHMDRYGNSYNTPEKISMCPKCEGKGEYYDFFWKPTDGNIGQVKDNKLLQELVIKSVMTSKGNNKFHPSYGTSISDSVAATMSVESVARLLEQQITKAIGEVRFRQDQQLELGQEVSDDELIYSLEGLDIRIIDERTLSVTLVIIAESGKSVSFVI